MKKLLISMLGTAIIVAAVPASAQTASWHIDLAAGLNLFQGEDDANIGLGKDRYTVSPVLTVGHWFSPSAGIQASAWGGQIKGLGTPVIRLGGVTIPGSSDLGDVSYECPAIQISCKIKDCENIKSFADGTHTREFAEAAASEYGISEALKCVKAFTLASIDLMTKPEILAEIKEEFSHVNE